MANSGIKQIEQKVSPQSSSSNEQKSSFWKVMAKLYNFIKFVISLFWKLVLQAKEQFSLQN
jgi:hypothetical protein